MSKKSNEILIIGAENVGRTCLEITKKNSVVVVINEEKATEPQSMPFNYSPQYNIQPFEVKTGKEKRRERRKNKKNK